MKTRHGFVSNSSSSSFIIAIKNNIEKCKLCGRSDVNLLQLIEALEDYNGDTKVEDVGAEAVIYDIENNWYDEDTNKEIIKKIKEYDSKRNSEDDKLWSVANVSISYHNDTLRGTLDNMVNAGTIEIIHKND